MSNHLDDLPNTIVSKKEARPRIVCLCGSTRFYREFQRANYDETMAGHIVLSVGFAVHSPEAVHAEAFGCTPEQKIQLDELHKHKIDLADEILVLNVGGYIGDSTRSEIDYAIAKGKTIRYLEERGGNASMLSLSLRQEFATRVLDYTIAPGSEHWFEVGQGGSFHGPDERRYTDWLEKRLRAAQVDLSRFLTNERDGNK